MVNLTLFLVVNDFVQGHFDVHDHLLMNVLSSKHCDYTSFFWIILLFCHIKDKSSIMKLPRVFVR